MDVKNNPIDWERIERDYRAGIKTLRQIAEENNITHGAINKRAKRDGWDRDLTQKIKQKAEALVSRKAVSKEVSKEQLATEKEIIEANAQSIAVIDLEHRSDVRRSRNIVQKLLNELDDQVDNKELYEQLGELMNSADDRGTDKLNEIYRKVISFGGRTDNVKKLADALRVLVELERKIVKLDDQPVQNDKQIGVEVSFV